MNGQDSSASTPATEARPEGALGLARFVLVLAVMAWALRSFIVQPFNIPSGSMLPTIYIGDYIAVAKWPYGYSRYSFPFGIPAFDGRIFGSLPKRGDVAVFRVPSEGSDLIKRVIGLPGDTIAMVNGHLILNGKPVPVRPLPPVKVEITPNSPCRTADPSAAIVRLSDGRSFCTYAASAETLPGGPTYTVLNQIEHGPADDFGPVRVPAGHIFLMGDNRDDSLDSRFATEVGGIGMVPTGDLIGRAMVTFWSTDGNASYAKPWTWFSALRASRIGNGYARVTQ